MCHVWIVCMIQLRPRHIAAMKKAISRHSRRDVALLRPISAVISIEFIRSTKTSCGLLG